MASDLRGVRVAVTGGTGFLGAHVVDLLVTAGADVCVVAAEEGWREPVRGHIRSGAVALVRVDDWWSTTSAARIAAALGEAEHLVHLAYRPPSPGSGSAARAEIEVNLLGSVHLLDALAGRVGHVCFASSTKVYGSPSRSPVHESACLRPTGPYGAAKVAVEEQLRLLAPSGGPRATSVRLSTLYGPGETVGRAVPNFIRASLAGRPALIVGPGSELVDYLHVRDAADLVVRSLVRAPDGIRVVNAGSGTGESTTGVAARVARLVVSRGAQPPPPPVHGPGTPRPDLVCDVGRAQAELGLVPSTELDAGLDDEIAWFEQRPELWVGRGTGTGRER